MPGPAREFIRRRFLFGLLLVTAAAVPAPANEPAQAFLDGLRERRYFDSALDYLNQQAGFYGAVENRVTTALDLAKKFETQDQARIGSDQDADIAAAALQMTQDTTHLNAAMASAAKQRTTSLFDYMR